ncbi:MAG: hypothetical protein NTV63_05415 [Candidatus Woesearchaeota archaeon]|nr:hypothetical protein [Candidatus Woesearchaeota archaeon]
MFCPKCGAMMKVKKHGSKKILACSCGHTDSSPENMIIKEKTRVSEVNVNEPETKFLKCSKCKHIWRDYS